MALRVSIVLLLLLACVFVFASEYKIIQRGDDGRYYLDEQTVIALAEYMQKLEALNRNYSAQIATLEKLVENLKQQIANYDGIIQAQSTKLQELQQQLEWERKKKLTWTVVAAIALGGVVLLFVK